MQKYATIELPTGNANAFEILAICKKAAENANVDTIKIDGFLKKAVSGNFENLLYTVKAHFHIERTAT